MAKKISTRPLCFATLRPHRLSKLRLGKLVPLNEEEPESSTDFILMASWSPTKRNVGTTLLFDDAREYQYNQQDPMYTVLGRRSAFRFSGQHCWEDPLRLVANSIFHPICRISDTETDICSYAVPSSNKCRGHRVSHGL